MCKKLVSAPANINVSFQHSTHTLRMPKIEHRRSARLAVATKRTPPPAEQKVAEAARVPPPLQTTPHDETPRAVQLQQMLATETAARAALMDAKRDVAIMRGKMTAAHAADVLACENQAQFHAEKAANAVRAAASYAAHLAATVATENECMERVQRMYHR